MPPWLSSLCVSTGISALHVALHVHIETVLSTSESLISYKCFGPHPSLPMVEQNNFTHSVYRNTGQGNTMRCVPTLEQPLASYTWSTPDMSHFGVNNIGLHIQPFLPSSRLKGLLPFARPYTSMPQATFCKYFLSPFFTS
jgi:hypothetical protein